MAHGVGTSTGAVTFNSSLQAKTPDRLRGRVFAGFDMPWQTGCLLSMILGGLLADAVGIRAVYYAGAIGLAAAAAGWSGPTQDDRHQPGGLAAGPVSAATFRARCDLRGQAPFTSVKGCCGSRMLRAGPHA